MTEAVIERTAKQKIEGDIEVPEAKDNAVGGAGDCVKQCDQRIDKDTDHLGNVPVVKEHGVPLIQPVAEGNIKVLIGFTHPDGCFSDMKDKDRCRNQKKTEIGACP